ncbi:ThiF family adenylyltransferase [Flammeovirga sp. EKP202]|uniref:ThiF family adenylyltransferase n=1 Tax=Flammeovirga sp. EKP202 TaxID=2770592 RepID=UPI00165FC957|nr:ThiF family adenylyltransferase [Flammeovirga sp. EKP202]MBD0403236.1 ThiF family adenylyltransferase [Flammeovirga sp. EKP202]
MSLPQIGHSKDLQRLQNEGYEVIIMNNAHIMISNIPYLNKELQIKRGNLIASLNLNGGAVLKPVNHTAHFIGEYPHNRDGSPMRNIVNSQGEFRVNGRVTANFFLSSKPLHKGGKYDDYYDLFTTYIKMLSSPAESLDNKVTAKSFNPISNDGNVGPFEYVDTNSCRANISFLEQKFINQNIGIIGVGGTGSYILDLVAKTPVKKILIFDGDNFLQHNAFRSPGAPTLEELREKENKAIRFAEKYSNMHKNVVANTDFLVEDNLNQLNGLTFVFIAIDDNESKKPIIGYLVSNSIPFIDVGISVRMNEGQDLSGTLRTTLVTPSKKNHIDDRIPLVSDDENEYHTNIQIADLNMINAGLAVLKWKQHSSFYKDYENAHNLIFQVNESLMIRDEKS